MLDPNADLLARLFLALVRLALVACVAGAVFLMFWVAWAITEGP